MMTYSLLHSDYPTIVRYISGAFIALGFCFFGPILLLIGVDIAIYTYRICWSRPWNQNQNQTSSREPRHLSQPQKAQPPPPLEASGGTTAVPSTSECEVMIKGLCFERKVFARDQSSSSMGV
ncbi:hypothetical protein CPAR01_12955 [Colletotrichum paranaense]|nr:uncharacterized protein CPAR01_12955 [Colletotrichum paranaense]KAK1526427.1 hypothetical protein CPAR01_12955 [Colletotrichum paranaense]